MHASLAVLAAAASFAGFVSAANQQIIVGGTNGLVFTPSNVTAEIGDTITFIYEAKNHTVTQSSFASPCTPLMNATTGAKGFDSSFVPVAANATENPAWTLQVTVKTPIWFYCRQATHCQQGMVGSINAVETGNKTFEDFLAAAKASSANATANAGTSSESSGIGAEATGTISSVSAPSSTAATTGTTSTTGSASTIKSMGYALLLTAGAASVLL